MNYLKPSFSVNPSGAKAPKDCKHGWMDWKRVRCVLCGERFRLRSGVTPISDDERRALEKHIDYMRRGQSITV